jgi:hypothetical protein
MQFFGEGFISVLKIDIFSLWNHMISPKHVSLEKSLSHFSAPYDSTNLKLVVPSWPNINLINFLTSYQQISSYW